MMRVAFRVDASEQIGIGHLMRCLTLAEALKDLGARTRFICRHIPESQAGILRQKDHQLDLLSSEVEIEGDETLIHSCWLGTSQSRDAEDTLRKLSDKNWDWLVVDHYALDGKWETALRGAAKRLMVIDDLADRLHVCDVLLDQNYTDESEDRYRGLVPEHCRILLGPRYALLRPEYAAYRRTLQPRDGVVKRVLVFFGGSDRRNMTALVLEALSGPEFGHLEVDVVFGADYAHRARLEQQASSRPRTNVYGPRPHLADLMAQADLAIGAGGATTWERMCLGLPSLVITLAENQIPIAELMDRHGLIRLVGPAEGLSVSRIREVLRDEINTRQYASRARRGMDFCDGTGALKVVEALRAVDQTIPGNGYHLPKIGGKSSGI